jgi:hypothetical protein
MSITLTQNIDTFSIFKALIKENIKLRYKDFLKNPPVTITYYHITNTIHDNLISLLNSATTLEDITKNLLFECVFSKGIHRAELFFDILNGILYFSRSRINFISLGNMHLVISTIIICSQIFGDANHRTAMFYLNTFCEYDIEKSLNIVSHIENERNKFLTCPYKDDKHDFKMLYEKQICDMCVM